jgi:hypothetical protein
MNINILHENYKNIMSIIFRQELIKLFNYLIKWPIICPSLRINKIKNENDKFNININKNKNISLETITQMVQIMICPLAETDICVNCPIYILCVIIYNVYKKYYDLMMSHITINIDIGFIDFDIDGLLVKIFGSYLPRSNNFIQNCN